MSRQIVARRYAEAFFALAQEQNVLSQAESDLLALEEIMEKEPAFVQVLANQRITSEQKNRLVLELFSDHFQKLTLNFLGLLFEKRREVYLQEIIAGFKAELDRTQGVLQGEMRTAIELSDTAKDLLKEQLTQVTGKEIRLDYKIEPDLIAGAVLKFGDKIIDGSIATRLRKMHLELEG